MLSSISNVIIGYAVWLCSIPVGLIIIPIMRWIRWVPSSKSQLQEAEKRVLQYPSKQCETFDVDVGPIGDLENCKIHTIKVEATSKEKKTPLVLIHGFGCAGAVFTANFDVLSKDRDVYSIDMLGYGLSSRASLDKNPVNAEKEMVHSIEMWRQQMKLDSFVLLGHSLGGFVSSAYTLSHPSRVRHLVLEDPWGFAEFDPKALERFPWWSKGILQALQYLNALSIVRAAGPYGLKLMKRGLRHHYYMKDYFPDRPDTIQEYLYRCNTGRPTGEEFFRNLGSRFGWPKYPMVNRFKDLPSNVGISFIHGSRSFIPKTPSSFIQEQRSKDNVKIFIIEDTGHTIHLERPKQFNDIVSSIMTEND